MVGRASKPSASERSLPSGKLPAPLLRELLGGSEAWPPELRLGPAVGEDACVLSVSAGLLVAATDPITLTGSKVGAHAVLINANDVAVMGVRPRWFLAAVLLPEGTVETQVRALFDGLRDALARVGAILVGGHTEITSAVRQPIVVGQMLGLAEDGRFVPTGGLRPGHVVCQLGPVPVEGAAVLAVEAASRLGGFDRSALEQARRAVEDPGILVVEPALLAAELGASALHDPTEGGLAAGLHELAEASGVRLEVNSGAVLWFGPGLALCEAVGADPWATLASGTVLAGFASEKAEAALRSLTERGFSAAAIAVAEEGDGVWLPNGRPLPWPERDEVARVLAG